MAEGNRRFWGGSPAKGGLVVLVPAAVAASRSAACSRSGGAVVTVLVGRDATTQDLYDDWVLVHEFLHLGTPLMRDTGASLNEGIATFYEPTLRTRAGWKSGRGVARCGRTISEYRLLAKVLSVTRAPRELPELRRYRVMLIDESHNLRNREGKRYRAIQEYIQENESKCILLSATPYNKTYLDLSSQLRLFVPEDKDLGIRPERLLSELGETEFIRRHQCPFAPLPHSRRASHADDWRELMRLYMVRRTRSFIQDNYAATDPANGPKFLTFEDGTRSYFPDRVPKTVKFRIDEQDPTDQYARLYAPDVVSAINALNLPRYGLANYVAATPHKPPTPAEAKTTARPVSRRQTADGILPQRTSSNALRAAARRFSSPSSATFCATTSSCMRSSTPCHCPSARRIPAFSTRELRRGRGRRGCHSRAVRGGQTGRNRNPRGSWELRRLSTTLKKRAAEPTNDTSPSSSAASSGFVPTCSSNPLPRILRTTPPALLAVLTRCGDWDPAKDAKLDALHTLLTEASSAMTRSSSSRSSLTPCATSKRSFAHAALSGSRVSRESRGPHQLRLALQPGQQQQARPGRAGQGAAGPARD